MSSKEAVIKKVKKLLAMALCKGASEQEKETAMRQARSLMQAHGVDQSEVDGMGEADVLTRGKRMPQAHIWLAATVARYFSCVAQSYVGFERGKVAFYGADSAPEIAKYAFVVLRRLMESDTADCIKRLRTAKSRAAGRDQFQKGWVYGLKHTLQVDFESVSDAAHERAVAFHKAKMDGVAMAPDRKEIAVSARHKSLIYSGILRGEKASIPSPGLKSSTKPRMLENV